MFCAVSVGVVDVISVSQYRFGRDYKRSRVNLGEAKLRLIFSWLVFVVSKFLPPNLNPGEE
ncbi:hypothetical protein [Myxosarcina sp. GI1(2024)]